jgi:hypothetical protein
VSGVLSVVCQLVFWCGVVRTGNRRTRGELRPARGRNSIKVEGRAGNDGLDEFFDYTRICEKPLTLQRWPTTAGWGDSLPAGASSGQSALECDVRSKILDTTFFRLPSRASYPLSGTPKLT